MFAARCVFLQSRRTHFDIKQLVQICVPQELFLNTLFRVKLCAPAMQRHTTRGKHTTTNITRNGFVTHAAVSSCVLVTVSSCYSCHSLQPFSRHGFWLSLMSQSPALFLSQSLDEFPAQKGACRRPYTHTVLFVYEISDSENPKPQSSLL